jgi:hypothetical protein
VLKAWMLQVRYKLVDKSRYLAAFKTLNAILYFKPTGTFQEKRTALTQKVHEFRECYKDEPRLIQYFEDHWGQKLGTLTGIDSEV